MNEDKPQDKQQNTDKLDKLRRFLTLITILFLAGSLAVAFCTSPDFSETVSEFLSSLSEEKGIHTIRDLKYSAKEDQNLGS